MTDLATILAQANGYVEAGQPEQAEAAVVPFLANGTGPIPLWAVLAKALRHQGRAQEALTIQDMLVQSQPGNLAFRFDMAETLLLFGQYDRGWREYHWRYSLEHTTRIARKVQRPRWDGRPIPGQTLLIHDEQGFGDTLQFIRLVEWAKQRSQANVVLEVTGPLLSIAKRTAGFDHIIERGKLPPHFDFHCEMMTLPMVMGFQESQLPGRMPYLTADPARVRRWQKRLKDLPRPLVPLVWAGRPTLYNGQNRATSLATMAPLAMEGVTFLSVQQGPQAEEAKNPPEGMTLVNLSSEIKDFEDTAAIFSLADLVITIDSAPAHLSGGLARPTWIMLGHVADWRWLMNRNDSPWYPTAKLFRQPARNDWKSVVEQIAADLAEFKQNKFPPK